MEDNISSKILKFADDTKVFRKVTNDTDKQSLQDERIKAAYEQVPVALEVDLSPEHLAFGVQVFFSGRLKTELESLVEVDVRR